MSSADFVVTDPIRSLGPVTKAALDTQRITVDLTPWLDVGEIISNIGSFSINPQSASTLWQVDYPIGSTVEPGVDTYPMVMQLFSVFGAGTKVEVLLAKGTPGFSYVVSFVATGGTSGRKVEIDVFVNIEPLVNTAMLSSSTPAPSPSPQVVTATQALSAGFVGTVFVENGTGSPITITLPPTPTLGDTIQMFDASGDAGTHTVTVQGAAGALIAGAASYSVQVAYDSATFEWAGSQWVVTGSRFLQLA